MTLKTKSEVLNNASKENEFLGAKGLLSRLANLSFEPVALEVSYKELKSFAQKALTSSPNPEHVIFFLDDFSKHSVLTELGANVFLDQPFNQKIPMIQNVVVDEVDEGEEAPDSGISFSKQSHVPKRFTAFVEISRLLSIQGGDQIENFIHRNISKALAAKVEEKLLAALIADEEINQLVDGLTVDKIQAMEASVNCVNDVQTSMGYACSQTAKGALKKLELSGGSQLYKNGKFNDVKILGTSNLPSGYLVYGDWNQAFILSYDKIELINDLYTLAKSGKNVLVINGWFSYNYSTAKSFSVLKNIPAINNLEMLTAEVDSGSDTTIELTFSNSMNDTVVPDAADFDIDTNGSNAVTNVSISGAVVTLTLTSSVQSTDDILVSYTPGSNKLQDTNGILVNAISAFVGEYISA